MGLECAELENGAVGKHFPGRGENMKKDKCVRHFWKMKVSNGKQGWEGRMGTSFQRTIHYRLC